MLRVGVVAERHAGRERYYRLERETLEEVGSGVGVDQFWAGRLRRLGERLAADP
jgi:hypothetical protein